MSASFAYRDRGTVRNTNIAVVTQPTEEPVSADLFLAHARIDTETDDDLIALYLTSARVMVERYLGRALVTQTLRWTIQEMDPRRTEALLWAPTLLELPRGTVQSVTSVVTRDAAGTDSTLDPAEYTLDAALVPARLRIIWGSVVGQVQHVSVTFVAGYGTAIAVPKPLVNAVLLTATHLYEHRGDASAELPLTAQWLCDPERIQSFGG